MLITYNIEVDDSGKVIVTADASIGSLPKGETYSVQFRSNNEDTMVQVPNPSPFVDTGLRSGELIAVRKRGAGPLKVVNTGREYRLSCGCTALHIIGRRLGAKNVVTMAVANVPWRDSVTAIK